MTVDEIVKRLMQYPEDFEVLVYSGVGHLTHCGSVTAEYIDGKQVIVIEP